MLTIKQISKIVSTVVKKNRNGTAVADFSYSVKSYHV